MIGTPKYAAPEMLEPGTAYGVSVDIFSLTVIMFELFSGKHAETGLGTSCVQVREYPACPNFQQDMWRKSSLICYYS